MVQTKKHLFQSFLKSSGTTAVAIVLVCVSVGAVLLPNLFADTKTPAPNVTATALKNASYQVKISWTGSSSSKWTYQYSASGKSAVKKTVDNSVKTATVGSLTCGLSYTFKVFASDASGTATGSTGSDTATAPCPSVSFTLLTVSGNDVTAAWKDTAGFDASYTLYLKAGSGSYAAHSTTAKSLKITGTCATSYTAYVAASAGGQTGSGTSTKTTSTAACPAPPPPSSPPPSSPPPSNGGGSSGGGSSGGGSSSGSKSTTKRTATSTSSTSKATPAPSTPTNFSATVRSTKLVDLSWTASSNATQYIINRSTDNSTWQQLAEVNDTSYEDSTTDFSTTYYYQVQAVGSDGQKSGFASVQATTDNFTSSSNTIKSDDGFVSVQIPGGAINQTYNCTLTSDDDALSDTPAGQTVVLGPYDLLCVADDGTLINSFKKPLNVTIKTSSVTSFSDLSVSTSDDQGWSGVKSTNDTKDKQITFTLSSAKTFAVFGKKHHSVVGLILLLFFLLLLIVGAFFGWRYWRRRTPQREIEAAAAVEAEKEFEQALAAPNCTHRELAQQVVPSSQGCLECEQQHTVWTALRICLICGHVGCSDDSPQQHALKHYHETGHPIVYSYNDPNGNIGWCYVDQTYI